MNKIDFDIFKYKYERIDSKKKSIMTILSKTKLTDKQLDNKMKNYLKKIKIGVERGLGSYIDFNNKWNDSKWYMFNIPKPTTFPKFNNEKPFYYKIDGKIKNNLEIIKIRWSGIWEYKLRHIGHENDFVNENDLIDKK